MPLPVFILIVASVGLSTLAQITLKHGMSSAEVQTALVVGGMHAVWAVGTNIFVIGGLALYGFGAILWLGVLARVDVSFAYPFVALGFVLTMALSVVMIGETLNPLRIAGTLLIALGAILVAQS